MAQQRHVIKQQILELNISSDTNSFELQNQISTLYRGQVIPEIDAICTQFSNPDAIHRIDRLEIDLGEIDITSLGTDFIQKVTEVLFEQLSQILVTTTLQPTKSLPTTTSIGEAQHTSPISPTQARFELFHEFLQTGRLPWWSKPLNRNELEECFNQLLAETPDKLRVLLQSSLKQEKILQRILYQFSEAMQLKMLRLLAPALHSAFCIYLEDLQRLIPHIESAKKIGSQRLQYIIWQGLFFYFSLQPSPFYPTIKSEINAVLQSNLLHIAAWLKLDGRSLIQQLLTTIKELEKKEIRFAPELIHQLTGFASDIEKVEDKASTLLADSNRLEEILKQRFTNPSNVLREMPQLSSTQNKVSQIDQQLPLNSLDTSFNGVEDIYLQNAGIVLLWPFLNHFFEVLNLVESGQFCSLQTTHQAILILQYLVDESLKPLESSLFLNKVLCGLNLAEPIPTNLSITEHEQNECAALLSSTIRNWSALGSLSIAGLRQAFLQRGGVLRSHREGWLLQVEHQSHDILLDLRPWSIQVIKLPWMEQVLHVEW